MCSSDLDFQPVAIIEQRFCMTAARHDFAIALDGDAFAGITQLVNQHGNAYGRSKPAGFAIK